MRNSKFQLMEKEMDSVLPMVCSIERNRERLSGMPHTVVEDMAVLYYLAEDKAAEVGKCLLHRIFWKDGRLM